jgi:hypothetical protein
MKRRDFLAGGLAIASSLSVGRAHAQPVKRAAIVIGVDKVGDLPKLNAAASGARSVADWLQGEGFTVKRFIDGPQNPVRVGDIESAITELVRPGSLEQLVIYFAGHGFINHSSEIWLLSDARSSGNQAISLVEAREASRYFRINNVVFISDACRSLADSLQTQGVRGSLIFPTTNVVGPVTTEVDKFLATRIGDPAWEVSVDKSTKEFQGIYTACFLEAFKSPYPDMVVTVGGKAVIPNRRLKAYLAKEVPKRAQAASIQLTQYPDSEVCSDEPTYIGSVTSTVRVAATPPSPTLADVASSAIGTAVGGGTPQPGNTAVAAFASTSGYETATNTIVRARGLPAQLSARSGFVVSGQNIKSVAAKAPVKVKFGNSPGDRTAMVEVELSGARAASVSLRFADGSGTVVAALDYYVGSVVVDQGRVTNVSYVPSRQSPMWSAYMSEADRLEQLRAAVAAAARFGVFRIEGPKNVRDQEGRRFAERIRMLKGIDPTLGLYAAYAYADAGLIDGVRSVRGFMRNDLGGVDLFDVLMLTGEMAGKPPGNSAGPFPFCPMLSQGWGLLRVRDVRLPERVIGIRERMRASLWTTIDSEGMDTVENALRGGLVS